MNGFKLLADAHRQAGQQRQAELLEILAGCTQEDICFLFDSTAFNDIAKGYLRQTCNGLEQNGTITAEQSTAIKTHFSLLFDEKKAAEIISN